MSDAWDEDDADLPPFAALLMAIADIELESQEAEDATGVEADDVAAMPVSITSIALDLPIELAVRDDDAVVASTPTQHVETTILPAFHRLRLTLEREHHA